MDFRKSILILFVIFNVAISYSQNKIDSIQNKINTTKQDTIKIQALIELSNIYKRANKIDKLNKILPEVEKLLRYNDIENKHEKYFSLTKLYRDIDNIEKAIENANKAIEIANNKQLYEIKCNYTSWLGYYYSMNGDFDMSIKTLLNNVEECEKLEHKGYLYLNYLMLGYAYRNYGDLEKALYYFKKSVSNKENLSLNYYLTGLNEVGNILMNKKQFSEALKYQLKVIDIRLENNDTIYLMFSYNDISGTYKGMGNIKKANEYLIKAKDIATKFGNNEILYATSINLALNYLELDDKKNSIHYIDLALNYAKQMNTKYIMMSAHDKGAYIQKMLGNYKKALEYYEIGSIYADSVYDEEKLKQISEFETKYETAKKDKEILKNNEKIKRQKILIYSISAGIAMVIIFLVIIFRQLQFKRKAFNLLKIKNNEILNQKEEILAQNEEIEVQKNEIQKQADNLQEVNSLLVEKNVEVENKNTLITDSIKYAKRIQGALLPTEKFISKYLPNSFVYYKPRDIVSGDFYWARQINDYFIIVAADCTGHGVPGAFMSMLGVAFLNEIITRQQIIEPNLILDEMRKQVKESLHQKGISGETKDGMDIALCAINKKDKKIKYAGAYNPLIYIRNNEINVKKANKQPIGIHFKENKFTSHEIDYTEEDIFYIFSDGFADQFGGELGKKFLQRNFKKLLQEIHKMPFIEQKQILDNSLNDWRMNKYPQLDDVLVIGFQINK